MHMKKAEWCESWMTDEEKRFMKRQMAAMRRLFIRSGVPESPFISMRAIDIGIHHLMVRRLEAKLGTGNEIAVPVPNFDPTAATVPNLTQLVDQIGKTRERLRKAMRELEEVCARLGKPTEIGLADRLLPLIQQTQHILHSPLPDEEFLDEAPIPTTHDIPDDNAQNDDSADPDSATPPHDIQDDTSRSGDIPGPESPHKAPDISDDVTRSGDILGLESSTANRRRGELPFAQKDIPVPESVPQKKPPFQLYNFHKKKKHNGL